MIFLQPQALVIVPVLSFISVVANNPTIAEPISNGALR
jgi:hypothetical protein